VQGDPVIYYSAAEADTARAEGAKSKPEHAFLDTLSGIAIKFTHPIDIATARPADFTVTDSVSGTTIPVTALADLSGANGARSDLLTITLSTEPDVTHRLTVAYDSNPALPVYPRLVLNDPKYTYSGTDLGNVYTPSKTGFRLWAPLATSVHLLIYKDPQGDLQSDTAMVKSDHGTWVASIDGNLNGMEYYYRVTNFGTTAPGMDPYAV